MKTLNLLSKAKVSILVVSNRTTITLDSEMHPADVDRLHENIDAFIKTCTKTHKFQKEFNEGLRP